MLCAKGGEGGLRRRPGCVSGARAPARNVLSASPPRHSVSGVNETAPAMNLITPPFVSELVVGTWRRKQMLGSTDKLMTAWHLIFRFRTEIELALYNVHTSCATHADKNSN